jgi:DNA repair exonuclease SbcCD ATPase subunit
LPRRLWKFEEKVMDLTSKLEVSRENVKVLKRGYAEKAAEMEGRHIAKEEILRRKLEEAEAKLQSAEQEMEEKDSLIDELQGALAGQVQKNCPSPTRNRCIMWCIRSSETLRRVLRM